MMHRVQIQGLLALNISFKEAETKSVLFPAVFSLPYADLIIRTHNCFQGDWGEEAEPSGMAAEG